jgi:hypothetical protein
MGGVENWPLQPIEKLMPVDGIASARSMQVLVMAFHLWVWLFILFCCVFIQLMYPSSVNP